MRKRRRKGLENTRRQLRHVTGAFFLPFSTVINHHTYNKILLLFALYLSLSSFFASTFFFPLSQAMDDPYVTLGVEPTATEDEIKKVRSSQASRSSSFALALLRPHRPRFSFASTIYDSISFSLFSSFFSTALFSCNTHVWRAFIPKRVDCHVCVARANVRASCSQFANPHFELFFSLSFLSFLSLPFFP